MTVLPFVHPLDRVMLTRPEAERLIEFLIGKLDDLDGDPDDDDRTSPETYGMGFVMCRDDDLEDTHDAEAVNEDGGDINDEPQDDDELEAVNKDGGNEHRRWWEDHHA